MMLVLSEYINDAGAFQPFVLFIFARNTKFADKCLSVNPYMLFFIQTLPRILCAGAISRVSFFDLFGPIILEQQILLCNHFSGELPNFVDFFLEKIQLLFKKKKKKKKKKKVSYEMYFSLENSLTSFFH